MDELIYASATALARAIRTKDVSSAEVVQAYLQRIEAVNPPLNAVVQLCGTTATIRAQFTHSTSHRHHGQRGVY